MKKRLEEGQIQDLKTTRRERTWEREKRERKKIYGKSELFNFLFSWYK